jgi:hypothetical protein
MRILKWGEMCGAYPVSNYNAYDPETIELLRTTLNEAWDALPLHHREQTSKSHMAQCVLKHAARGERHPGRLRLRAIADAMQEIASTS